jgi:hypothetical protein
MTKKQTEYQITREQMGGASASLVKEDPVRETTRQQLKGNHLQ